MNETSSERLARLLALVPWLRLNDGVTIERAAEHFAVTPEQLTTDLWQLIVCGIPGYGPDQLVDIQFWDDDRIHVLDPIALAKPLKLSGDEAAALLVALRVLAQIPGSHDRDALRSAMAKIQSVASVDDTGVDVAMDADASVSAVVANALESDQALLIRYAPGDRDALSHRRIDPRASYSVDGQVYLEAFCHVANDVRTFRLDRILEASVAGPSETVTMEVSEDAPAHRPVPADLQHARIAVDPAAAWIWDTDPVTPDSGEWGEHAWPTGSVGYASVGWLVRYILGHAGRVLVLDPPEARSAVARQAKAKLAAMRTLGDLGG